jgi:transposase
LVETVLEQQPYSGHVFVFRGKRGRFVWPQATSGTVALTRAQLSMLLEGIDWRQPQRTWEPQLAG